MHEEEAEALAKVVKRAGKVLLSVTLHAVVLKICRPSVNTQFRR